jgi:outer membrane protein assembly factor BamB
MPSRVLSSRVRHRRVLAAALMTIAAMGSATSASAQEADPWPMAGRDAAHSGTAEGPVPPYREAWSRPIGLGGPVAAPSVAGEALIVVAAQGVTALDPATGDPLWEADRTEGPAGAPALAGDLVVHASGSGSGTAVVARAIEDGAEAWRAFVDADVPGGLVVADGLVYAATAAGEVVALEPDTGEERWRSQVEGRLEATPAVAEGLVLVAGEERQTGVVTVFALDAATGGRPRWRFSTPGPALPASAPASVEGRAYVATSEGVLRALDLDEGAQVWEAELRAAVSARQIVAASEPLVVADRLHLYGIGPGDGEERWTFLLADLRALDDGRRNTLSPSSPAVIGGTAVIGDTSGLLSAVDVGTGRRIWREDLGPGPLAGVAVGDDLVFATTLGEDGSVIGLEHDPDGALLDEASPTEVFPLRAILNFVIAAAAVGAVAFGLSRVLLRSVSNGGDGS